MGNHLRSVAGYFTMPWMFGSASYIPSWRYISEYGEKDTVYDYAGAAGGRRRPAGLFEMRRWRDGQSQLRPVGRTAGCRGGNAVSGRAGRFKGQCAVSCLGGRSNHRRCQPEPQAEAHEPSGRVRNQRAKSLLGLRGCLRAHGSRSCVCCGKRL